MSGDDVTVLRDEIQAYRDGTVARVRVLSVPESERFPEGIKYAFHYGDAGADHPVIRFELLPGRTSHRSIASRSTAPGVLPGSNHHGPHELHVGDETFDIGFPGLTALYDAWRAALPEEKRVDWYP